MGKFLVRSHAKINIALNILDKRPDGYHSIDSVMVPLELHDSLIVAEHFKSENFVTIDNFSLHFSDYNIATSALDAIIEKCKIDKRFRVIIHKVIPIKAGMGGGSSNAAAVLVGLNKKLKLGLTDEELIQIGVKLGADVPFFIKNVPARCTGVGEIISPISIKNDYYVLIVKPSKGLATKAVFEKADELTLTTGNIEDVIDALATGDDDKLANSIHNSLEAAAISLLPDIQEIKNYLKSKGLNIVQMTGSGSAVFALSKDKKLLRKIEAELEDKYIVELTKILKNNF